MEALQYKIVRSRRKTLSVSVSRTGEVVVRAPLAARDGEVQAFVLRHVRWIEARRARLAANKLDLSDGAVVTLLGVPYTIAEGPPRIRGGVITLPREGREAALTALLRPFAKSAVTALVNEYAARYGFTYRSIRITSARGRWGSCNARGALAFSFRTAFLSEEQLRYVVVHELCHTKRLDHSALFWREVGAILPNYIKVRRSLRAASVVMDRL